MHRIGQIPYRQQFILKGAMLFSLWSDDAHRATRDLDLLGGGASEIAHLEAIFHEIIILEVETDTPAAEEIVYPSLLDLSRPQLLTYPRATVIAIARQLFCRKTAKSFEINQAFANLQNYRCIIYR
jgi:hypothetical protein